MRSSWIMGFLTEKSHYSSETCEIGSHLLNESFPFPLAEGTNSSMRCLLAYQSSWWPPASLTQVPAAHFRVCASRSALLTSSPELLNSQTSCLFLTLLISPLLSAVLSSASTLLCLHFTFSPFPSALLCFPPAQATFNLSLPLLWPLPDVLSFISTVKP